jgi:predicted AlkP superfamily phosphohydrolase/phosphomutase
MLRNWTLALLVLLACGSCRPPHSPAPPREPVWLVAADGLEWSVALPLIEAGRMPHLKALMGRGRSGRLETYAPAKSPVIWTTVATGKLPQEHGITDFTYLDANGQHQLFSSRDRRTKALWEIASDAGRESLVVSWWNTFPVDAIDGVLVAQANTMEQISRRRLLKPGGFLHGVAGQVHPAERQDELLQLAAEAETEMPQRLDELFGEIGKPRTSADRDNLEACVWSVLADESTLRIASRLIDEEPTADLVAIYFGTPDVVSHRFWRFARPESFEHPPTALSIRQFGRVVDDAYAYFDSALGKLLEQMPPEATLLLMSDHGMHAVNSELDFDRLSGDKLERESGGHPDGPPGLLVAVGPHVTADAPTSAPRTVDTLPLLGHVIDVAPTMLALMGLPAGEDMQGQPLLKVIDADWLSETARPRVPTHDNAEWLAGRGGPAAEFPGSEERLRQLESLGYIDRGNR